MKHYVYKIIDPITNEFYFGSRSHINPIKDNYMGSYKVWKPDDKNRLLKEIISDKFETRADAIEFESQLISKYIDNSLNRNYNIPNKGFNTTGLDICSKDAFIKRYGNEEGIYQHTNWLNNIKNTMKHKMNSMTDEERSKKFGSVGNKNPNYGNIWSDEWKDEQSKRMVEYYKNHTPARRGATHNEETKKKMSEFRKEYYKNNANPRLGIKYTDEQKNILKEALKKQPKLSCPHCGVTTNKGNAMRWHFDNCKKTIK
jgi:ribosomal protein L37AE/L43A